MKLALFFFVMAFSSPAVGQRPVAHAPEDHLTKVEVVSYPDCGGLWHLYVKATPYFYPGHKEKSFEYDIEVITSKETYQSEKRSSGEFEIYNLPTGEDSTITVVLKEYHDKVLEQHISTPVKLNVSTDIVTTTDRVDDYLVQIANPKTTGSESLPYQLCDLDISRVELLAFFSSYMQLTRKDICLIMDAWSEYTREGVVITPRGIYGEYFCSKFEEYLLSLNNSSTDNCLCRLVNTTSAAINHTADPTDCNNALDETGDCFDFIPLSDHKNFADNASWGSSDNELAYNEMIMGAAKGAAHHAFFDGGNVSPNPFSIGTRPAISELTYNMVCVNPNTLQVDLSECSACKKHVTLKYMYSSKIKGVVRRAKNVFGSKHSAWIALTDFATLNVVNGSNVETFTDSWGLRHECLTNDNGDTLYARSLRDAAEVLTGIYDFATNLSDASLGSTAELAIEVIGFVENHLLEEGCTQISEDHRTLLSGEQTYELLPGNRFSATMISGASFSSYNKRKGEGRAEVNSTFYMTGILLSDQEAVEKDYCECEKVGNYVLGSVEDFSAPIPRDRDGEHDFELDWANLYSEPAVNLQTMKNTVGAFLGVNGGDWEGKMEPACTNCDVVDIPCYADCVYVRGCSEDNEGFVMPSEDSMRDRVIQPPSVLTKDQSTNLSSLQDRPSLDLKETQSRSIVESSFYLYPNPTDATLHIGLGQNRQAVESVIFDLSGNMVLDHLTGSSLDISSLSAGLYFIRVIDTNQEIHTAKFIKL